jgi:hypothetical protein
MNDILRDKLAKVYALVEHGGTEGEKQAARVALDKILDKHNIQEADLASIHLKEYWFNYASQLDIKLLILICNQCCNIAPPIGKDKSCKSLCLDITYMDWITIESMYGYFKPHMRKQWLSASKAAINKCRKTKTKNEMRRALQDRFFSEYIQKSSLYRPEDFTPTTFTAAEAAQAAYFKNIEGGNFNKQVITHKQLNN